MNLRPALLSAVAVVVGLAAVAPRAQTTDAAAVRMFETESRVEVDATGQVLAIETTPALPAPAQATVEAELRRLRFAPAKVDGRAVGGVTYVQMDACVAPDNGAFRFAAKYRGNGPSLEKRFAPVYPQQAERAGAQSRWKITYEIAPDGKASVVSNERVTGSGGRFDPDFRAALTSWVEALHFRPELVEGHPVSTQVSDEVEFVLVGGMNYPSARKAAQARKAARARVEGSEACQLAMAEGDDAQRAVALNSPFKVLPAN